jgi:hypothetical protein
VNPGRVTAALVLLAAAGILRILFVHFISEPRRGPRLEPIDPRYQALRTLVRAGEAGYVSDLPVAIHPGEDPGGIGTRMYWMTQFALAPVVLRYDDAQAKVVIANVADPAKLPEVLRQRSLALVAVAAPGVAVARPR